MTEIENNILQELLEIPIETCHPYRNMPATYSGANLPLIPAEACHQKRADR